MELNNDYLENNKVPNHIYSWCAYFAWIVLTIFVMSFIMAIIGYDNNNSSMLSPELIIINGITIIISFIIISFLFIYYKNFSLKLTFGIKKSKFLDITLTVLGILSFGILLDQFFYFLYYISEKITIFSFFSELFENQQIIEVHKVMASTDGILLILMMLILVVIQPIVEELLFRGYIFIGFLSKYGVVITILLSSLLFGILHFTGGNIIWFVQATLLGIYLGVVRYMTGSIISTIICHIINNLVTFISSRYLINENEISYKNGYPIIIIIISLIVMSYMVYYFIGKIKNKKFI